MRCDSSLSEVGDELGSVIPFVCLKCQPPGRSRGAAMHHFQGGTPFGMTVSLGEVSLNNQTVPVLHQRMAHEAQRSAGAWRFLIELCLWVRSRSVCRIRTLLSLEVDLGVAVAVIGEGHRFSLGFGLGGLIVRGDEARWGSSGPSLSGGSPSAFC